MSDVNMWERVAKQDVEQLVEKNTEYGDSWKKRGGVGAFMMLARKWDRIETQMLSTDYTAPEFDILQRALEGDKLTGLLDDIGDLRRYLLLVEAEVQKLSLD